MFFMMYIYVYVHLHTHTLILEYIFLDLEQDMYVVYNSIGGSLYCVPAVFYYMMTHSSTTDVSMSSSRQMFIINRFATVDYGNTVLSGKICAICRTLTLT